MSSSEQSGGSQNVVSLDNFSVQELVQFKEQLEQEISQLTSGFTKLKQAQATFRDCKSSLNAISEKHKDKAVLVPLTESLYVPGKLSNIESVLVDVGTGYYVEKDVPAAKKFYDKKSDYLQKNSSDLQKVVEAKQSNLRTVIEVLQYKSAQLNKSGSNNNEAVTSGSKK